jgi:hypothetical protein
VINLMRSSRSMIGEKLDCYLTVLHDLCGTILVLTKYESDSMFIQKRYTS